MKITRSFSFPSQHTFTMKPAKRIISRYFIGAEWADPFAGYNSPAKYTNDLNPKIPALCHMEALDFLRLFNDNQMDGVFYDRPYSSYQAKECYGGFGVDMAHNNTVLTNIRNEIARIVKPGGYVLTFCWNTQGIGKNNGFEIVEILIITHGDFRNDTLVTVEQKTQGVLE